MFEKYLEQTERFLRPMNEIWALQTQAAESFTKTNSNLLSDVWQGGLSLAQSMPAQKSMDDAIKLQQAYWQGVSQTLQKAAEENHSVLTNVNQKIADVMQNTSAGDVADDVVPGSNAAAKEAAEAARAAKTASAKAAADLTAAGRNASADPVKAEAASTSKSTEKNTQKSAAKSTAKKSAGKAGASGSVGKAISNAHGENPATRPKASASPKTAAASSVPPASANASSGKSDGSKSAGQNKPEQGRPSSH